ncbi:dystroglycan 1 [Adelges cooleyi]|uniref:dystroglycan 1 n=1 Tax=Adelges cooleyi TaxID=133065 RepID=UPI00217FD776|nr:dystroglycan 1 [Adelges cooleyi]XP_050422100.1 dystroglycan 1 [Adelges cooleyi]XP_050422101.1 dystroglycan 1 [Adelges cooleyi]
MKGLVVVWVLCCLASAHKSADAKAKWWSIPEPVATVGKLFYFKIPHDLFVDSAGPIDFLGQDGGGLPSWLVKGENGELEGIPGPEDVRDGLLVRAGDKGRRMISDVAYIRVAPLKWKNVRNNKRCKNNKDSILLCLVIGMNFKSIQPLQRLIALKNLAGFLSLPQDAVLLVPQESVSSWLMDNIVTSERPQHKKHQFNDTSFVLWEVGCGEDIWQEHIDHVRQMQSNAVDGTLSEVLQLPVTSYRLVNSLNPLRGRRQVSGTKHDKIAANFDDDDDETKQGVKENDTDDENDDDDNDDDDDDEIVPDTRKTLVEPSPVFLPDQYDTDHLHRHYRRDENVLDAQKSVINSTPVLKAIVLPSIDSNDMARPYDNIQPTPTFFESMSSTPTTSQLAESVDMGEQFATTMIDESASGETTALPTDKLKEAMNGNAISTTTMSTATNADSANTPPVIKYKLPKLAITAGKPLKYAIPDNVFYDHEDGSSKNLKLSLLNTDPALLSWVEFDTENQILVALPLEEHVSKWEVIIQAQDSAGLGVNNTLDLVVQQLPHLRAINHQIILQMRLKSDSLAWTRPVHWSLDIIEKIAAIYSTDANNITVLNCTKPGMLTANKDRPSVQFKWTNDTLPRNTCPNDQILQIISILKPEKGNKAKYSKPFGATVVLEDVSWEGLGNCASITPPSSQNFEPVLRNPVDLINATYGQLLSFVVPDDTFFDAEDSSSHRLKLSLMTIDRSPVPPNSWLQFDPKNQEFYGIPLWGDKNFSEYQLICTDREGKSNHDSLVVSIHNATKPMPTAEFDIVFKTPEYREFNNSALLKKSFVEHLATLFKDETTSNIVILGVNLVNGMTMVTWYNKSLEVDRCDENMILRLRQVILSEEEKLTDAVAKIMSPSFNVVGAHVVPSGMCEGGLTEVRPPKPPRKVSPRDDNILLLFDTTEEYFSTLFVPAIIILIMIFIAGILACLLYRRRPSSKLRIGDNDRQSFRSRGIPVIFQDEMDERLEPTNKTPIIMREEKPPLPPPDYQRSPPMATTALLADTEDSPYQPPPPPFSSVGSNHRSKPTSTPSYRKPPPYVPP